jgi:hypothetical protein
MQREKTLPIPQQHTEVDISDSYMSVSDNTKGKHVAFP